MQPGLLLPCHEKEIPASAGMTALARHPVIDYNSYSLVPGLIYSSRELVVSGKVQVFLF